MPGSNTDITSLLLHLDAETRARTLVVEFPAGFSRPSPGRYQAGEEVLVLAGSFTIGSNHLTRGDWAWLPPRLLRRGLHSERGATVYAWFSAGNDWQPAEDEGDAQAVRLAKLDFETSEPRPLGRPEDERITSSAVVVSGETIEGPADILELRSFRWTRLEAGEFAMIAGTSAFVRWDNGSMHGTGEPR